MVDDWLDAYVEYSRHQVSPVIFRRWAGIAVLGAALERRVWLTRGYEKLRIFPGQLMIVLVGKSAMQKKTTAANMAVELLNHLKPWQFNLIPDKTSPQELWNQLQRVDEEGLPLRVQEGPIAGRRVNSSGFINAGELAVFFSTDAFNEMLAATINTLNDATSGRREVRYRSWRATLWNPLVGMLGCITPKGIAEELPRAARTAGFFGRILWVHSNEAGGNPLTELVPEQKPLTKALREMLSIATLTYGSFQFTQQGKTWFEDWYWQQYYAKLKHMDAIGALDTSGYWGRKDGHLLRVAMVCAMSRSGCREKLLRRKDLERALQYLDEIEAGFGEAMAEIGVGPYSEENARVLGYIETRGGKYTGAWVPHRDIARFTNKLGMRGQQVDDCLGRLLLAEELESGWHGGHKCWRRRWASGDLLRRAMEENEATPAILGQARKAAVPLRLVPPRGPGRR